jgi:hypothetical protein
MLSGISGEVKTTVAEAQTGLVALISAYSASCGASCRGVILRSCACRCNFGGHGLSDSQHGRFATGTDEGVRPYTGARLRRRWTGKSARPHTVLAGVSLHRLGLVLASGPLAGGTACGRFGFLNVGGNLSACGVEHVVFLAVTVDLKRAQEMHQVPRVVGLNSVGE